MKRIDKSGLRRSNKPAMRSKMILILRKTVERVEEVEEEMMEKKRKNVKRVKTTL